MVFNDKGYSPVQVNAFDKMMQVPQMMCFPEDSASPLPRARVNLQAETR